MGRIPGKWEWIEEKLREIGELQLADLAWRLNESMKRIYGKTATEGWEIVFDSYNKDFQRADSILEKAKVVLAVVRESGYCVACDADYVKPPCNEHDMSKGCRNCKLAKVHWLCSDHSSTFSKVYWPLKRLAGYV
ncbi:MAG: hypothetical protein PHH85_02385 [Candidatus Methanoperedens sp.]|nr:hypothetical protein [Candidatus Methanoperedens sp.]